MPKVSVIIPTYNGSKYIKTAVSSVLGQTFRDFEIIIVDDYSSDDTSEICEKMSKENENIRFFRLGENFGSPAKSRNIGLREAKGDYIFFLDQDDIYFPKNMDDKVNILDSDPAVDIVIGASWVFDNEKNKFVEYSTSSLLNWACRKNVFNDIGVFNENEGAASDIGWSLRYLNLKKSNNGIKYISEPSTIYFKHFDQDSNIKNVGIDRFIERLTSVLDNVNNLDQDVLNVPLSSIYERLGDYYCLAGFMKKGREYFIKSNGDRLNIIPISLYILSFLGQRFYRYSENIMRGIKSILLRLKLNKISHIYRESYNTAINLLINYK